MAMDATGTTAKPFVGPLLDPIDHGHDRDQRTGRAQQVEPTRLRGLELREQERGNQQQQQHRRNVDQEDRAPPEMIEQQAGDDRAENDAASEAAGPDADRGLAFLGVVEHVADQGQRRRHQRRGRHSQHRPGGDQHLSAAGVRGDHGYQAEQGSSDQQQPAAPDPVAQSTHRDQRTGQTETVGVHDP